MNIIVKNLVNIAIYIIGTFIEPIYRIINKCRKSYLNTYERKLFAKCGRNLFLKPPFSIRGEKYIKIGENLVTHPGLRLECIYALDAPPTIQIGNNCHFAYNCHIGCINRISIGNNVVLGSNVLIEDHSHGTLDEVNVPVMKRPLHSKGSIIIEDNVWIGENACILPNIVIGKCSIIGAGSIVTHSIPPYSIAVGNPAKVIKQEYH